jgi:hypothetical protein
MANFLLHTGALLGLDTPTVKARGPLVSFCGVRIPLAAEVRCMLPSGENSAQERFDGRMRLSYVYLLGLFSRRRFRGALLLGICDALADRRAASLKELIGLWVAHRQLRLEFGMVV